MEIDNPYSRTVRQQAYGYGYPNNPPYYQQPYQATAGPSQVPMQAPSVNVVWVQGIEGAKAYPVLPNQEVMLMDSEAPVLYTKKADGSGKPIEFEIYDLVPRKEEPQPSVDMSEYAKISDIQSMVNRLIDERFDAFTSSGKK